MRYHYVMGFIRKVVSGTAASVTGGASLFLIQFRSDTERGTHQTRKLRGDLQRQNRATTHGMVYGVGGSDGATAGLAAVDESLGQVASAAGTDALSLFSSGSKSQPDDFTPGWKPHPEQSSKELFWNGTAWTTKFRTKKR